MRALISKPPGSTPPGSTTTTRSPGAKLCAPQTMPWGSPVPFVAPTSTVHQLIVLPLDCGSASIGEHPPDDQRAADVVTGLLQRLELEAERGQLGGQVLDDEVLGQGDVVPDPGHGGLHGQISVPKAAEKRTSPSNMLRRSAMPCRNISVRSMPIPKAKPV